MSKEQTVLFQGEPIAGRMPPFKPELRQAIRDDRKTQTRRLLKPQPPIFKTNKDGLHGEDAFGRWWFCKDGDPLEPYRCPYGKPGDLRVMIEPLHKVGSYAHYRDDNECVCSLFTGDPMEWRWSKEILTSIHMPHEAARTACRYTEIRVERVQEINQEDAKAEGVWSPIISMERFDMPVDAFRDLWDAINLKRGHGWNQNDWVWIVSFSRIGKEGK